MSQKNESAVNITEKELKDFLGHVEAISNGLQSRIKFTVDPREVSGMGPKSFSFARDALRHMQSHPDLVPNVVNLDDFVVDLTDFERLNVLSTNIQTLLDLVNNAAILAGSEANDAARIFYRHMREDAKSGVPNTKSIYDDLSRRYPNTPTKAAK